MVEEIFAVPTREVLHRGRKCHECARAKLHARIDNPYGDDEGTWFIATSPPTVKWIARSKKWGSTPDLLKLAEIEKAANSWQMKSRKPAVE